MRLLVSWPCPRLVTTKKCIYAAAFFFPLNQLSAKASILLLYHRIFGINKTYTRSIIALGVLQITYTVAALLTSILQCVPVKKYWKPLEIGGSCIRYGVYLATAETVNCVVDFAMATLAVIMLRDLQMSKRTKHKLAIVFTLGAL